MRAGGVKARFELFALDDKGRPILTVVFAVVNNVIMMKKLQNTAVQLCAAPAIKFHTNLQCSGKFDGVSYVRGITASVVWMSRLECFRWLVGRRKHMLVGNQQRSTQLQNALKL
jgi:hypothetical protein